MKISKIIVKTILLILIIVMCNSCICYGDLVPNDDPDLSGGSTEPPTNPGDNFYAGSSIDYEIYKPSVSITKGDDTYTIISTILGFLQVIGVVLIVISIALIGFNTILGSASEKAANQEKYVGLIIAAILLTSGSIFAKFIISFAETI